MVILRSVSIYVICTFVARMAQQGIDFYLDKCYTFCLKRRNASSKQYKCVECQKLVSKSVGNVKVPLIRVSYGVYSDDPLNPAQPHVCNGSSLHEVLATQCDRAARYKAKRGDRPRKAYMDLKASVSETYTEDHAMRDQVSKRYCLKLVSCSHLYCKQFL